MCVLSRWCAKNKYANSGILPEPELLEDFYYIPTEMLLQNGIIFIMRKKLLSINICV